MEEDMFGNKTLRAGIFMVLTTLVFILVVWSLGQRARIFSKSVEYRTKFKNVSGLAVGADVAISGYLIGNVTRISLPKDIRDQNIIVELSVGKKDTRWIRRDTKAWIKTMGLLGDKYIELTQGSVTEPPLPPGSMIESVPVVSMDEVLMKGGDLVNNILSLTVSAREVFDRIGRGEGLLGKLITDEKFSQGFTHDSREAVAGLKDIVSKINNGRGAIGVLVNDTKPAKEILDNLHTFSFTLKDVGESLDQGQSLASRLIKDNEQGTKIFNDLVDTSDSLKNFTGKMNPDSVIGRLTTDKEYADQVLGDLETTSRSMAGITEKIDEGKGTLGMLVNDKSIYQEMSDVLQGVNNSRLTRWFVRRTEAIGAKDRFKKEKAGRGPEE
jgi:phospholipid/cholesterol/gamma-HCH transport system substrate-binding protein